MRAQPALCSHSSPNERSRGGRTSRAFLKTAAAGYAPTACRGSMTALCHPEHAQSSSQVRTEGFASLSQAGRGAADRVTLLSLHRILFPVTPVPWPGAPPCLFRVELSSVRQQTSRQATDVTACVSLKRPFLDGFRTGHARRVLDGTEAPCPVTNYEQ